MRIVVRRNVAHALAELPEGEEAAVRAALAGIPSAFGRPHIHSGLGLRQLKRGVYEARVGLHLRAVFTQEDDGALHVRLLGNHDDVRRYLRHR
ncbi:MAG: hypothetical protein HY736_23195 [Verrucomicrobia bacterium]|nr:hypothetical protein [Verrucomicrobiota bacterium]